MEACVWGVLKKAWIHHGQMWLSPCLSPGSSSSITDARRKAARKSSLLLLLLDLRLPEIRWPGDGAASA